MRRNLVTTVVLVLSAITIAGGLVTKPQMAGASPGQSMPQSGGLPETDWVRIYGTSGEDEVTDIGRLGCGDIYVTGYTTGDFGGQTNSGGEDVFVARLDPEGEIQWVRLLGSPADERPRAVAVTESSYIYITGYTSGDLGGSGNEGITDIFVASFSKEGHPGFVTQLGTSQPDSGYDVAIGGGSFILVVGNAGDIDFDGAGNNNEQGYMSNGVGFLARLADEGWLEDVHLLGGPAGAKIVAIELYSDRNVFIAGETGWTVEKKPLPEGIDSKKGFVAEYNWLGERKWLRYIGTDEDDEINAMAWRYELGTVAIVGSTVGDLGGERNSGWEPGKYLRGDAFVWVDDVFWNFGPQWARLVGSPKGESAFDVACSYGNTYLTGCTLGDLHGAGNAGGRDVFLTRYGPWDHREVTKLLGSASHECGTGIHVTPGYWCNGFRERETFVTGYTYGELGGEAKGGKDMFLWKLREVRLGSPIDLIQGDFEEPDPAGWTDDGSGTWGVTTASTSTQDAVGAGRSLAAVRREAGKAAATVSGDAGEILANGVYQMTGRKEDKHRFSHHRSHACDFVYEADVRKTAGDSAESLYPHGVVFRTDVGPDQLVPRSYYEFVIVTDGRYMLGKREDGGAFEVLAGWTQSSALHKGHGAWNTLKVVAAGERIELYANDQQLTTVEDGSFDCGAVGLMAIDAAASAQADTVQFDNVHLQALPPGMVPTPPGTEPRPTDTVQPTATATRVPGTGISGRVTVDGSPTAGIELRLRHYDGSDWETQSTDTTDRNGTYSFQGVPSLDPGEKYYVRYGPNSTDPKLVNSWWGPDITSYAAGTSVSGGDFDIANVDMISPASGTTVSLPATFVWQRRSVPGDTYHWLLTDPVSDETWTTGDLGSANQYTLHELPDGAEYDTEYRWHLRVYDGPESHGTSYYYRRVTFSREDLPSPTLPSSPTATQEPTATRRATATGTPDTVQTSVAATLTAMVPTRVPTDTPDTVQTMVAATLTAMVPSPTVGADRAIYLPIAHRAERP